MQGALFRQQAMEQQTSRLHGQVLVAPRLTYSIVFILLIIWVSAAISWLFIGSYANRETVSGWLEPPKGVVRVFPEASQGKIKQILVDNGSSVTPGQPLIIINGDKNLTNGFPLEEHLLNEYKKQRALVEQQLNRLSPIYQLKTKDLKLQLKASKQDFEKLESQENFLQQRLQLIDKKAKSYHSMAQQGSISAVDAEAMLDQHLALKAQLSVLLREKVTQQNRIEQLNTQLQLLPNEQQNQLDELNQNLSQIAQQIAQLHGQRAYVIKAVTNGIVSNLQARLGQQVNVTKPLMTIVPTDLHMEANLLLPVRAAGFVESGQSLEIRYHAFPYQKFGLYQGHVIQSPSAILLPNELSHAPVQINEPVYLVKARLAKQHINAYGQQVPLKAGMTLSADIQLTERSLAEWLIEPLYSLKGRL